MKHLRRNDRRRADRRGAAAVEFAVVAPLFFLLLAGIIEFGQAFHIEHALSSAARRGARSAILEGATNGAIESKIRTDCVEALGVVDADVTVAIKVNGGTGVTLGQTIQGDEISVAVSIPFSKAGVGFYANTFGNSVLSSTCIMESE